MTMTGPIPDPPIAGKDVAIGRLCDYYLDAALTAASRLARRGVQVAHSPLSGRPDLTTRQQATAWTDAECANLLAITDYCASNQRFQHAISIPAAIAEPLLVGCHWEQAVTMHQAALTVTRLTGDRQAEAKALSNLGAAQRMTGRYGESAANQRAYACA
jgi:hypothetical protein